MKKEDGLKNLYILASFLSVGGLLVISYFILGTGIPAIFEIGVKDFLFGRVWKPEQNIYGIYSMILTSGLTTLISVALASVLGILTSIYLVYYAPPKIAPYFRSSVELLAGVPSVVFGLFALSLLAPLVKFFVGGTGKTILTGSLLLSIMILPTIVSVSEASLKQVPRELIEASLALGISKEHSIFKVALRSARSGILSSIILALGRALGEATAIVMVVGNQVLMPNLLRGGRSMTGNIIIELGYAQDLHREALIATAAILFIIILIINLIFLKVKGVVDGSS